MITRRLLSMALCIFLLLAPVRAESPRVDANGDPLPPNAIARLGSLRFLHGNWPHSLAFFPDGRTLLAAGQEPFARAWNVADGREVRRYPADSAVMGAALSPDGKTVSGCDNSRNVL